MDRSTATAPDASVSLGSYTLTSATQVADKAALDDLLRDYYGVITRKLAAAGVPRKYTAEELKAPFWSNLDKFLPPSGRLILIHDDTGTLVGCGTLRQIRADAGEVKRLYVRPSASGHGLGRAIVNARLQAARRMSWRRILVNAMKLCCGFIKAWGFSLSTAILSALIRSRWIPISSICSESSIDAQAHPCVVVSSPCRTWVSVPNTALGRG